MPRPLVSGWFRRCSHFAVALFAVLSVTAQLGHHDIACHLKTPQPCTACAANPPGSSPHAPSLLDQIALADAGGAFVAPRVLTGTLLPVRCSGRAPPASA